jgi:hypothetical protein
LFLGTSESLRLKESSPERNKSIFWGKIRVESQGCQMVYFQSEKIPIWEHFRGPWYEKFYFTTIWNILRPFGKFYGNLV